MMMRNTFRNLLMGMTALMLMAACDPKGTWQMNRLGDLLNAEGGPVLTIDQLMDSISELNRHDDFSVLFPLTDVDQRPLEGVYQNPVTGSTLQFHPAEQRDSILTVGTVDINQQTELEVTLTTKPVTKFVQARGKSVYALYEVNTSTDSLGTGRQWASWSRVLLFVYPGGDSIMTTRGSKHLTHIFRHQ